MGEKKNRKWQQNQETAAAAESGHTAGLTVSLCVTDGWDQGLITGEEPPTKNRK